ncbi:12848_t:CDS:2, partial [Racocetra persica]
TRELQRISEQWVVLKKLDKFNQHNSSWFNEVTSHFTIDKIAKYLVSYYRLTQDPETGDFMLVLDIYDCDLRKYLRNDSLNLT